jgi:hypothetical protein
MVPFVESSVTSDEDTELEVESGRAVEADPLRRAVHVALALYLTPVVALVCLIGGVSILFGRANKVAERLAFRPPRRDGDGPLPAARPGGQETGPRLRDDRGRTRIGH